MVAKVRSVVVSLWHRLIKSQPVKAPQLPIPQQVDTVSVCNHTRTIDYWAESGHFFRWQYTADTLQQTWQHVANLADDPCIELSWPDVARVHYMIEIMEATQDCRDVVGL